MKYGYLVLGSLVAAQVSSVAFSQVDARDRFFSAAHLEHQTGSAVVSASDPRPLWMALNALQREYGWLVDFEDPIFDTTETKEQSNHQWENTHNGSKSRVPSGTTFTSSFAESTGTMTSAASARVAVGSVVKDYNNSQNPGLFSVKMGPAGRLSVVGRSRIASSASVLDESVRLPGGPTSTVTALDGFVAAVSSKSGQKIMLGMVPYNLLGAAHLDVPDRTLPARELLAQIADSTSSRLQWDLLYDYDSGAYVLSLRPQSIVVTMPTGVRALEFLPRQAPQSIP